MYDKHKIEAIISKLTERIYKVRPAILDSSLYGGSNLEMQKQQLIRAASELKHGAQSNSHGQVLVERAKLLEGQLQTAAAIGLIGDRDLQQYLGMIDDIYVSLDQEN